MTISDHASQARDTPFNGSSIGHDPWQSSPIPPPYSYRTFWSQSKSTTCRSLNWLHHSGDYACCLTSLMISSVRSIVSEMPENTSFLTRSPFLAASTDHHPRCLDGTWPTHRFMPPTILEFTAWAIWSRGYDNRENGGRCPRYLAQYMPRGGRDHQQESPMIPTLASLPSIVR